MKLLSKLFALLAFVPVCALAQQYVLFNGGVGTDERATAPDEGTRLVFFADSGKYLSGIQVTVENSDGRELVNTRTNGPWLILDLPAGQYQVHASLNEDNSQGGVINVNADSSQEFAYMFTLDD